MTILFKIEIMTKWVAICKEREGMAFLTPPFDPIKYENKSKGPKYNMVYVYVATKRKSLGFCHFDALCDIKINYF